MGRKYNLDYFYWVVYIAIAIWMEWPVLFHPFTRIIGGIPDAYQYTWYLGWFWHAVSNGLNPLYSHQINYPQGIGFMYNTSIVAESFLFGWLVPLTSTVFVYNLIFFLNIVLIGTFGRLMLRQLGLGEWLSTWGAIMFCIMPYLTAQELGHVSQYFISPLFIAGYLFLRFIKRAAVHPTMYGSLVGFVCSIEFYTSLEVTVTSLLTLCIFLGYLLLQKPGRMRLKITLASIPLRFWASLLLVVGLLATPGVIGFVLTGGLALSHTTIHASTGEVWVADLLSPLLPTHLQIVHFQATDNAVSHFNGHPEEKGNYLGVFLIALAVSLRGARHGPIIRSLGWTTFSLLVLSFGDRLHIAGYSTHIALPWLLLSHLPFLGSALPMRLAVFVDIGVISWVGLSLQERYESRWKNHLPIWIQIVLVACFLTWLPGPQYPSTHTFSLPKSIVNQIGDKPVYFIGPNFAYEMQPMAASGYVVNSYNNYGYTPSPVIDNIPDPAVAFYTHYSGLTVARWSANLRQLKLTMRSGYIVLNSLDSTNFPVPTNLRLAISQTLGKPSMQVKGCELWGIGLSKN